MIQTIIMSLIMSINFMFIQLNHPLAMGLMLLIQTTLISMLSGTLTKTFWFSYILFLIFMGGLLVLFIYVTSLASNEMFSLSLKMVIKMMMILTTLLIMSMILKNMNFLPMLNIDMNSTESLSILMKENSLTLTKMYNYPNNLITLMLMNYLLITLIAVVKITKAFKGPLRMMN